MVLGAVVFFYSDRDFHRRKTWNPSLKSHIAEVMSSTSHCARTGCLLGNVIEILAAISESTSALSLAAGRTTGISICSFLTVSAQLLNRAPFYKRPCYFLWDTCSIMSRIAITSDQTKPRSMSVISKSAVELPWVCSCFIMEWCMAELHPRAVSGHRGSSELLVPLRASIQ